MHHGPGHFGGPAHHEIVHPVVHHEIVHPVGHVGHVGPIGALAAGVGLGLGLGIKRHGGFTPYRARFMPVGGVWPWWGPGWYAGRYYNGPYGPYGVGCPLFGFAPGGMYYGPNAEPQYIVINNSAPAPAPTVVVQQQQPQPQVIYQQAPAPQQQVVYQQAPAYKEAPVAYKQAPTMEGSGQGSAPPSAASSSAASSSSSAASSSTSAGAATAASTQNLPPPADDTDKPLPVATEAHPENSATHGAPAAKK